MNSWLLAAVLIVYTFFDARRDALASINCDPYDKTWWEKKLNKWISFYSLPVLVLYWCRSPWYFGLAAMIVGWIVWQIGLRSAGVYWPSLLIRFLQWLKKWIST